MSGPVAITEKPSGFSPKNVNGLQLWLDASDSTTITQDGSTNIVQWRDKSVNGYTAISNANYGGVGTPTYVTGTPSYVNLQSAKALNIPNFSYTTSWTVFSCMCNVTLGARWYISPYNNLNLVMMGMAESSKIFNNLLTATDITGPHIEYTSAEDTNGTGSYVYYRDGSNISSNSSYNNQAAKIVNLGIGANGTYLSDSGGVYYIYEILIYNTYLSDPDRQNIESYLAQKWGMGLVGNLPAGHPVVSLSSPLYTGVYKATERMFDLKSAGRCALWLDASDVNGNRTTLQDQTTITQWIDKSGNNRSTTLSGTIKYNAAFRNGNATLSFSPDDSSSVSTSIATAVGNDDYALMAVWKITFPTTAVVLALGPNSTAPSGGIGYNSSSTYNFFEWGQQDSGYTSGLIGYVIHIGTRIGGVRRVFINGNTAPSGTGELQNITDTTVIIGNGHYSIGFPSITGEICELAIFNGTITESTRKQIEGYFAAKWSIPLVAGHPYSLTRNQDQLPYPVVSLPRKITSKPF